MLQFVQDDHQNGKIKLSGKSFGAISLFRWLFAEMYQSLSLRKRVPDQ
jgi:hypothetical protein